MDVGRYLLDTHSLIWLLENNLRIPQKVISVAQDPDNIVFFSQVSLFEIAIKQKVGKLPNVLISAEEIFTHALASQLTFLPIQNQHIYNYSQIPLLENHRDPFDRLLIATANYEKAAIITADEKFIQYQHLTKVLW